MLLNIIISPVLDMHWSWRSIDFLWTDVHYLEAIEIRRINEVSASCFKNYGVQYGAVDCTQYHLLLPCLSQNSRLIVVDAKDRTKKY